MRSDEIKLKKRPLSQIAKSVKETKKISSLYRQHKLWVLKSTYLYSSLNYSRFLSNEILQHTRQQPVDKSIFYKNNRLTREALSGIIQLDLRFPIESYLVLKKPLTVDALIDDIELLGAVFLQGSAVNFCKIKSSLIKYLAQLGNKKVVLDQLSILKSEDFVKYKDMIRTGILNFVIESSYTNSETNLQNCFLAGILHDIGFLYLDPKYHKRAGQNFSVVDLKNMQCHTELGFHILKPWFNDEILKAAINHHLGEDKTGYPRNTSIPPSRISGLTGFASSFVVCCRKYKLQKAMKIQEIYSREKSHFGEPLTPFFKREFFEILNALKLQFNKLEHNTETVFSKKYAVVLHNFMVYLYDLAKEIEKIDRKLLDYVLEKAAHRADLQNDIDDVFDYIKKIKVILNTCGKSPGIRQIMADSQVASGILGDVEIISMELHRNNRFFIGLFKYLNSRLKDMVFEKTVLKLAKSFSGNIKRNLSDPIENEISVFDLLHAISD